MPVPGRLPRQAQTESALEGDVGSRAGLGDQDRVSPVRIPRQRPVNQPVMEFLSALFGKPQNRWKPREAPSILGEVPSNLLQLRVRNGFRKLQIILIFVYCSFIKRVLLHETGNRTCFLDTNSLHAKTVRCRPRIAKRTGGSKATDNLAEQGVQDASHSSRSLRMDAAGGLGQLPPLQDSMAASELTSTPR